MSVFIAGIFAFIACGACFGAFWVTYQVQVTRHTAENRMQKVEDQIQSLRGKLSSNDRWSRDEIRDAVDAYLQTIDLQPGGSSMEDLLPMLLQMQMGQATAPGPPSGTDGDAPRSDTEIARQLSGQGGINGQS